MGSFKEKTIRGGVAKVSAQATAFVLRLGSLMVMARLLDPKDFGLVGMVTAFTGVLNLFRDFGLSAAAVQRAKTTEEQVSTLFWINLAVGATLSLIMVAAAPAIATFYHEPRLVWVSVVLASGFVINAAGVQHSALLQRQMRFTTMAGIDVLALAISISIGIAMALRGFGYWSLVATAVTPTVITTLGLWTASAWLPGKPQRGTGMRSMLRFGGTLTLNGIIVYIAYNLDKVLLGRWWGAQAVGLYGRANQLISIPTDNLNYAAGEVAFPALARIQDDPVRLKRYFLKGYSLILALTAPITISGALFAPDLITVVLGPQWHDVIQIFRFLSPTILIIAIINPLIWLVLALGLVGRSLRIGLVYAPLIVLGCVAGLRYGPTGVAIGYSTVLTLWFIPHIAWAVHDTVVSLGDVLRTASRPVLSAAIAGAIALALQSLYAHFLPALPRLVFGNLILFACYIFVLSYVMGQKALFLELFKGMGFNTRLQVESVTPDGRVESQNLDGSLQSAERASKRLDPPTDVLFIAADFKPNPGGIAEYLDNLARGLMDLGNRVKVIALVDREDKERRAFLEHYESWVTPLEVAHDERPKSWLGNNFISLLEILRCTSPHIRKVLDRTRWFRASCETVARLEKVLAREEPALIVLGHLYIQFYSYSLHLKDTQRPYAVIAHDVEFYRSKSKINDSVRRGMIIRGAEWIAANSRHTKSLVEEWGVQEEKIIIVHPAVSEQAIRLSHHVPANESNDEFTLVTVSRLVRSKGIDTVLRALKILDQNHVNYRYIVAGKGSERLALEQLAKDLGVHSNVRFTGFIEENEKWRLLRSADVYVMPSRFSPDEPHEGFGIAFVEAAACGIPAIGSNAGGVPDAVLHGKTGLLVEPDSPEELAKALMFLYLDADKRREMGAAGMQRVRTDFSPRAVALRFQNETSLRDLIESRRREVQKGDTIWREHVRSR